MAKITISVRCITFLIFFSGCLYAQGQPKKPSATTIEKNKNKVKVDEGKPTVYLHFEEFLKKIGQSNSDVIVLSFNNNTKWKLVYKLIPEKEMNDLFPVLYNIEDSHGQSISKRQIGDVIISVALPPGAKVKFFIPENHWPTQQCLSVEFNYEWEKTGNKTESKEPRHRAYLCRDDLPQK